jgi:hypothetical protein
LKDGLYLVCKICKNEYHSKNKEKLFPKITCTCGKTLYKYYLVKHLKTKYHDNLDKLHHSTEIEAIA